MSVSFTEMKRQRCYESSQYIDVRLTALAALFRCSPPDNPNGTDIYVSAIVDHCACWGCWAAVGQLMAAAACVQRPM